LYGYRHDTLQGHLALLAQKYECCEWITELSSRFRQKDEIYGQIRNFCSNYAVNKCEINKQINGYGGYIVLAAAIAEDPSLGDENLLMEIQLTKLPKGNAQRKILDAIMLWIISTPLQKRPAADPVSIRIGKLESRPSKVQ
jgi:hypothetical protein